MRDDIQPGDKFAFYGILRDTDLDDYGTYCPVEIPCAELYSVRAFPALVRSLRLNSSVVGSLWTPSDDISVGLYKQIVERLDQIEGFLPEWPEESLYVREETMVIRPFMSNYEVAWTYVWNQPHDDLELVPSGDWWDVVEPARHRIIKRKEVECQTSCRPSAS